MSTVYIGKMIKEMRLRMQWQQERLQSMLLGRYDPVLYRVETGKQLPRPDSLNAVMDALKLPIREMICPRVENVPMETYILRYGLLQALDNKDVTEAETLLGKISELMNLDTTINRQFYLSQSARLMELQGRQEDEIVPLVLEALNQTYDDFDENSPGDRVLIFEEPELFHTLARLYARQGNISTSIRILKETYMGLLRLPIGLKERDIRLLPILSSLSHFYMQIGAYRDALETCDLGFRVSAMRNMGQGTPDFLCCKAEALLKLNRCSECGRLLKMAYAGYLLLGEREKALDIRVKANAEYGITFQTYGMENLSTPHRQTVPYARGQLVACTTVGEMIRTMRKAVGLKSKELCRGICSESNMSKIEKGSIHGHMHYVEPILQRLGRDPLLYCNFFLTEDDFEAREMRDTIHLLLAHREYGKAAELLEKLKTYKAYKFLANSPRSNSPCANLQFVKRAEATIFAGSLKGSSSDTEAKFLEALHITIPEFDEDKIRGYPLSIDETCIINRLAGYYMESGDAERAAKIYKALIGNVDARYVDEFEKARMYAPFMFNLSTCLGRLNKRGEALEVIGTAEIFERNRGRLLELPAFAGNKAYNLMMQGDKEISLAHFALAYYGFSMFEDYGYATFMSITQGLVKKHFGIEII